MSNAGHKSDGFTLVEMLVAVSLLGLLGVISWRGLDQVIALRTRVNDETVEIERVVRTIAQIERDIDMRVADVLMAAPPAASSLPYAINIDTDSNEDHRCSYCFHRRFGRDDERSDAGRRARISGSSVVIRRLGGAERVR